MRASLAGDWPELAPAEIEPTLETLHRWLQIVGKTRLALAPMQNHWWQVTLYVTARGLSTSAMPGAAGGILDIEADFLSHELVLRVQDGAVRRLPLAPMTVARFSAAYPE